LVLLLVVGAAVCGAFAGCHPTGSPVIDQFETAIFAGGVTLLVSCSSSWDVVVGERSRGDYGGAVMSVAIASQVFGRALAPMKTKYSSIRGRPSAMDSMCPSRRDTARPGTKVIGGRLSLGDSGMLPAASVEIADYLHIQNRGRKTDPLYRCRRLLTKADERLDERGKEKLLGLLRAGDPNGDVTTCWHAKEAVRELYSHGDPELALQWVERLGADLGDTDYPTEARSLGRTLIRWKHQIAAWHQSHVSNGPTEAVNNLIKRVKRAAFGFMSFRNYRIRSLLYAGKPNWDLLATIRPRGNPKSLHVRCGHP
jgi:hypothetical protein